MTRPVEALVEIARTQHFGQGQFQPAAGIGGGNGAFQPAQPDVAQGQGQQRIGIDDPRTHIAREAHRAAGGLAGGGAEQGLHRGAAPPRLGQHDGAAVMAKPQGRDPGAERYRERGALTARDAGQGVGRVAGIGAPDEFRRRREVDGRPARGALPRLVGVVGAGDGDAFGIGGRPDGQADTIAGRSHHDDVARHRAADRVTQGAVEQSAQAHGDDMGADAGGVIDRARHRACIGDHDIIDAADRHQRGARGRALDRRTLARCGDAAGAGAMAGIGHARGQRVGRIGAALDQVQRPGPVDAGVLQLDMVDDAGIGLGDGDAPALAGRARPGLMHQCAAQRPFLVGRRIALRPAEDIADNAFGAGRRRLAGIAIGRRAGIGFAGDEPQPVTQRLGDAVKRILGQGHVDPVG